MLNKNLAHTKEQFEITSKNLGDDISRLENHLASTTSEKAFLNDFLSVLKARNSDYQNEINDAQITVSQLRKLTTTDPELLQKYSKIYFLNENYVPVELSLIDTLFLFRPEKPEQIHTKVKPFLEMLLRTARAEGIDISVVSAYRSFGTQSALKSQYTVVYGTNGANRFSADQGYSEHQLGTTADFTTKKNGEMFIGFDKSPAYAWLKDNAHRFGFTLSYPPNNKYYVFEPWHWRFIGVQFATDLHTEGKYFNDLGERDINSYLIKLFD
jgi:D-alanyl-D-alanine carboxypeptidase